MYYPCQESSTDYQQQAVQVNHNNKRYIGIITMEHIVSTLSNHKCIIGSNLKDCECSMWHIKLASAILQSISDVVRQYISIEKDCRWNKSSSAIHICRQHLFSCYDANISFDVVVHLYCLLFVICARLLTRIIHLKTERSLLLLWTMNQTKAYNLL